MVTSALCKYSYCSFVILVSVIVFLLFCHMSVSSSLPILFCFIYLFCFVKLTLLSNFIKLSQVAVDNIWHWIALSRARYSRLNGRFTASYAKSNITNLVYSLFFMFVWCNVLIKMKCLAWWMDGKLLLTRTTINIWANLDLSIHVSYSIFIYVYIYMYYIHMVKY